MSKMTNPSPSGTFFDYYKLPGPWYNVKYAIYYWFFTAIKMILRFFDVHTKHGKPEDNDGPHELNNNIGYDATWIGGTTPDGKWIILALDRRNDCKMSIGYACLKIPGIGHLSTPMYPNSMENELGNSDDGFTLDRFTLTVIEPLRRWKVNFEGEMTFVDDPETSAHVKITAEWTSQHDVWLLNRDLSSESFADSFALENWTMFSATLFDRSKDDVVHWEQFGRLDANIEIDKIGIEIQNAATVRDRSFGKIRDFTALHRYFYITMFLEDGRSMVITVVCHKKTFSRLFFGFISNDDGTNSNIDWTDLNIYQFGENGRVAGELCFLIRIGKVIRTVQVVCDNEHWYRLEKGVVRCEQIGDCLVDHVPGKCMIQSLYSETSLRAKTFCKPLSYLDY
ncbi:uncharacterized protein LOC111029699 [Myzus persicae]|uniref:uncharacterized protein LOC111029699 n=1 Tax=Myzus persicae TaxID=13164 RepID=UPI000B933EBC|nr:uncharacterized protein LOC111029699 [Myzus persicae]